MKNRVCTLYRVSTDKQVDHNDKNQADIPMQRKACHAFCEKMGWVIVHEEQEEGVSGHKVRAENRDKLQIIKELAKQKKFDILLVFMFDRIGRIADETPFVVEWFVKNGIEVWSTQEGEQRFDIISWAEMYDTASMEAKKMIVNCLIKRVDVYRDYKLHIDFNIDFEQFCGGLDIVTIAA